MVNGRGQLHGLVCHCCSCRPKPFDLIKLGTKASKLGPENAPTLFKKFDCMARNAKAEASGGSGCKLLEDIEISR